MMHPFDIIILTSGLWTLDFRYCIQVMTWFGRTMVLNILNAVRASRTRLSRESLKIFGLMAHIFMIAVRDRAALS